MTTASLEPAELNALSVRVLQARESNRIYRSLATKGSAICRYSGNKPRPAAGVLLSDLTFCDAYSPKGRAAVEFFAAVAAGKSDAEIAKEARSLVGVLVTNEAQATVCAIENGEAIPARFIEGSSA